VCLGIPYLAHAKGIELDLIQKGGFDPNDFGFVLFDPGSGVVLSQFQSDKAFIPASMIKLATALAALEVLGADFRFETSVLAAPDRTGALRLQLVGGGDPVLVQEDLQGLARQLRSALADRAVGQYLYDDANLPYVPQIDPTDDALKPYNPPVSALSVNFNRQWLRWSRDALTRAMSVRLLPNLGDATAGLASARSVDGRSIQSHGLGPVVYLLDPLVPSAGQRRIAVLQPALRTAAMLRDYAAQADLSLPLPMAGSKRPFGAKPIASHLSRPMLAIAADLLEYSNNLSAELIGFATAEKLHPGVDGLPASAKAVQVWLDSVAPDISRSGWSSFNQSGLTSRTRATPNAFLALLRYANARTYGPDQLPFAQLLHEREIVEGEDGMSLRAKSGTMFYARGLAGELRGASGRPLLFVMMHTDFAARLRYEADPMRYTAPVQIRANAWLREARAVEAAILGEWAKTY
jgi:D-alanyl-D-alanine carboxypeptidase/D-alanyl-D-alanine-endopeptidase (penicillin-binding protein 4)